MSSSHNSGGSNPNSPTIDPNSLNQLDFEVLDAWDEETNGDNLASVKIKQERVDPDESRSKIKEIRDPRRRTSSDANRSNRSHESRHRSESRGKFRNKNHSPLRKRTSPPRRTDKTSFLEELKETFEKEGKDSSFLNNLNVHNNNNNNNSRPLSRDQNRERNYRRQQYEQQQFMLQQQQQQQNAMNNYNYGQQQFMQNMMPMQYQQFNAAPVVPQMGYDMYGNPMMQPVMMMPVPEPVPAPQMIVNTPTVFAPQQSNENSTPRQQFEPIKPKPSGSNTIKKALEGGKMNLTDILRQKSKQQSKEQFQANSALSALKQTVKDNCMKASDLITDLENKRSILPFKCAFTYVQSPLIRQDSQIGNRSPLVMSENNVYFQFQTPPSRCRTAFERNPLKKLHDSSQLLMPLARNMKYDMLELTLKVKEQILTTEFNKEVERKALPVVNRVKTNPGKGIQTDPFECEKCSDRLEVARSSKSKSVQTIIKTLADASTQSSMGSEGDFNVVISAEQIANMNFQQNHAFKTFIQEFNLNYEEERMPSTSNQATTIRNRLQQISRRVSLRDLPTTTRDTEEDRMNYANPENPRSTHGFISFSPPRNSIFDRLSPMAMGVHEYIIPSPPRGALSLAGIARSPPMFHALNRSRSRSRSVSPLAQRSSQMRRNRSPNEIDIGYRNRSSPNGMRSPKRSKHDDWSPQRGGRNRGYRGGRGRY